tara:strand:- start:738 stop:1112 length:375 start_codon:yes stop_codon:yes gene_type:complete
MSKKQLILFLILDYTLICIAYYLTDFDLGKQGNKLGSLLLFLLIIRLIVNIPYLGINFLLGRILKTSTYQNMIGILFGLIWIGLIVFEGKENNSNLINAYILMCLPFLLSLFLSHKLIQRTPSS